MGRRFRDAAQTIAETPPPDAARRAPLRSRETEIPQEEITNTGVGDDATEPITNSFVVVVAQEVVERAGPRVWRGHVTHVPSGTRRYFTDLAEIVAFITSYFGAAPAASRRPAHRARAARSGRRRPFDWLRHVWTRR